MKAKKINEDLSTEESTDGSNFENLSKAVKNAFKDLSENINHTTGIIHHHDEHRAKTYIRTLHKYEKKLDSDVILSFLILNLGWEYRFAKDVKKLIDTLNNGKYFQGGETKGLQYYYKRWENNLVI